MKPIQHPMMPLTFTGWDDGGQEYTIFYGVVFTKDFGPIVEGEVFSSISVVHEKGLLEIYDKAGKKVLHSIPIQILPK